MTLIVMIKYDVLITQSYLIMKICIICERLINEISGISGISGLYCTRNTNVIVPF
jgi:hypothetical protein